MKKRLMILAGSLLAIAAVATTVVGTNSNDDMSLLAQNVEALAQGETNGACGYCYSNYDYDCHVGINGDWSVCEYMNWNG